VSDEDFQLRHAVRELLGEKLLYTINKKRNFVHARERETIFTGNGAIAQELHGGAP
jgi:hypothetical protein